LDILDYISLSLAASEQMPSTSGVSPDDTRAQLPDEAPSDHQTGPQPLGGSGDDAELAAALDAWEDAPDGCEHQEEQDDAEGGDEEEVGHPDEKKTSRYSVGKTRVSITANLNTACLTGKLSVSGAQGCSPSGGYCANNQCYTAVLHRVLSVSI
jgi:hypothetical protein